MAKATTGKKATGEAVATIEVDKISKKECIEKFQRVSGDTGSPEVQIALLTGRIRSLNKHFTLHAKDHGSRRGLMKLIGQRRKLLQYLQRVNPERYQSLIEELEIRR